MAEVIAKTYRCDRCHSDIGTTRGQQKTRVIASKEGEWAMDWVVDWKDLCPQCEADTSTFFCRSATPAGREALRNSTGGEDAK